MVEDLRTLSLADQGQLRLEMIEVAPDNLVEQVVHAMLPLAEERGITLTAGVQQPVAPIRADGDRLAEVLTNLIGNALRYAHQGRHVTVSAAQENDRLMLEVADDGPGLSPDELPFVFERFWRGDRSRSRDSGGSGIGLAIVRQLVELHGGTVSAESKPGEGTTFRVALPAS
jgi:two-component system sensor histidine kinase BaeS